MENGKLRIDFKQTPNMAGTMKPVSPIADFSYDYQDLLFTPAP
jgi:hypothetical protein